MDTLFLESIISAEDRNPFQILDGFLGSANHNLKYLGLLGVEETDQNLWCEEWRNGLILADAIEIAGDDNTLAFKVCFSIFSSFSIQHDNFTAQLYTYIDYIILTNVSFII